MSAATDLAALPSPIRALVWTLLSIFAFTGMGSIIKHVAADMPIFVFLFLRMTMTLVPFVPWIVRHGRAGMRTKRLGDHLVRGAVSTGGLLFWIYALTLLTLADVTAISFSKVLWVLVLAVLFLGERVGLRRGIATLVGFAGVLIMVRPGSHFEPAMLLAVGGSMTAAVAMILIKRLSRTEPTARIVIYYALTGMAYSAVPAALTWQTPTLTQLFWIAGAGGCAAMGQFCMARALSIGDTTLVAVYEYLKLPFATLAGLVLFAEFPGVWTFAGAAVIIASTWYITWREAQLKATGRPVRKLSRDAH